MSFLSSGSRLDLRDRTVLLTGAASGIGAAAARVLHARGARLALVDQNECALVSITDGFGDRARAFPGSVTDRDRLDDIVEQTLGWTGALDVVWANAGIAAEPPTTIRAIDADEFERVVEVDLHGVWRTVRAALPAVVDARGHVLVTASTYAWLNGMANAPYAAAKAAVESFGRSLRAELAGTGTTAGVLYPGWIETPIVRSGLYDDPVAKQLTAIGFPGPFGRTVPAAELAEAAVAGIERRAARTVHPRRWVPWFAARGVLNPLMDAGIDRHRRVQRLVRLLETSRGLR